MMGSSPTQSDSELFQKAVFHHDQRNGDEALKIAIPLSQRGYDPADFLIGIIYEFGTYTSKIDAPSAVTYYRRSAFATRCPVSYRYLARALLKCGESSYGEAHRCLIEAQRLGPSPEVDLGFAWYHETAPVQDLRAAGNYYMRAAMRGRFMGFFGYARVARKRGQRFRALIVDIVRIASGVFLFILLGRKATNVF